MPLTNIWSGLKKWLTGYKFQSALNLVLSVLRIKIFMSMLQTGNQTKHFEAK